MRVDTLFAAAPKTASTWLFDKLVQNKHIGINPGKYTRFFRKNYEKGIEWYDSHFPERSDQIQAVVDFEPMAIVNPISQRRVFDHASDLKLMIGVRNPIERDWSAYQHMRRLGQVQCGFDEALEDKENYWLTRAGHYASYLPEVLERFSRTKVHFVVFDDIRSDPEGVVRRVERFLGVAPQARYVRLRDEVNKAAAPRLQHVAHVARTSGQWLRQRGYGQLVQQIREHPLTRNVLFRRNRAAMGPSPVEFARIVEHYRADVEYLQDLLDRDLSDWLDSSSLGRATAKPSIPRRAALDVDGVRQ